jgi:Transposase DDE domain/Transposase domain (DUF772)
MFKKNRQHLQMPLTSHVDDLPEKLRERLENSWAGAFYRDFFCRLNEDLFAVLYDDCPSRPNIPVNVMVSLEFLKAGHGWTDEEMYDHFCYDIQVRYALGYRQLGDGHFELRTQYYFRERLSQHMQDTGENLLDKAFEQVTDEQLAAYHLKTDKQRMDSFQIGSNIRNMGRIQLLVEVLQRVHRMLDEADQLHYAEDFAPYLKGHAGHYVYRMKNEEAGSHLERMGGLMARLLGELQGKYAENPVYKVLARVFGEHFRVAAEKVSVKPNQELSASSLQSPDDLEATYREKRGVGYQGYVTNVTETCNPENDLQLIAKVQTACNTTDDSQLLAEAIPNLAARTDLSDMYTDGGHGGPTSDEALAEAGVQHIQTAIRGREPNPAVLSLADFDIHFNEAGQPAKITCPEAQSVSVQASQQGKSFVAHFDPAQCANCPLLAKCSAQAGKCDVRHHLRFTLAQARSAERRRTSREKRKESGNLRSAVEATVRCVKLPYPDAKLPVRGKFRVACMMIGSAAVTNIRRIQHYALQRCLQAKKAAGKLANQAQSGQNATLNAAVDSFFAIIRTSLRPFWGPNPAWYSYSDC